jgi:hypothetical protein
MGLLQDPLYLALIFALDEKGAKTGDASSANAFEVDIMNKGLTISSRILFINRGLYKNYFVPKKRDRRVYLLDWILVLLALC